METTKATIKKPTVVPATKTATITKPVAPAPTAQKIIEKAPVSEASSTSQTKTSTPEVPTSSLSKVPQAPTPTERYKPKEIKFPALESYKDIINDINKGKATIVDLVNKIVKLAYDSKASDIHIESTETTVRVRYRIDGLLREMGTIDKSLEQSLIFRIKIASKLRTDEHFAPQDGKIKFIFGNTRVHTRISILPTTMGEKIVMRLLVKDGKSFKLEDLGYDGINLERLQKAYKKPYGMILATGPTGSGKTTSLYAILQLVNSPQVNITTVEDPVEYDIEGVNHIQVNSKAKLTFASGLRSILRQDPNIIMVGEIRDTETARIAINAALTGHLVLSTLHTNDAITTIPRLIDMGIEPFLVASTINLIIAQRLARRLCENCKKEMYLTKEEYDELLKVRPDIGGLIKITDKFYRENGCNECGGTGSQGRIGLYEVLEINEVIRRLITEGASIDDIYKLARRRGLELIVESGVRRLQQGIISIYELQRVTALKE